MIFKDEVLLSVLLDDASSLAHQLKNNPEAIGKRYTIKCAFTPLYKATLLHICAEFNHVACAEILVQPGIDIHRQIFQINTW